MTILVTLKGAVPALFTVTICAVLSVPTVWLAKVRVVGAMLTAGVPAIPVPESKTLWGLRAALS
jgi:hypothetical protein